MPKGDISAVERIIANTINETARGDQVEEGERPADGGVQDESDRVVRVWRDR